MIDTDKYEGHLLVDGEWIKYATSREEYNATKALIKDAPLLLEEVKRLREENERLRDMVEKAVGYGAYDEEYRSEEE